MSFQFEHFNRDEFQCKCGCGGNRIKRDFVQKLNSARHWAGIPFVVNSGWRCKAHNARVGGVDESSHYKGMAADIVCLNSRARYRMLCGLIKAGFTRIGIYGTFLHVDTDTSLPEEVAFLG